MDGNNYETVISIWNIQSKVVQIQKMSDITYQMVMRSLDQYIILRYAKQEMDKIKHFCDSNKQQISFRNIQYCVLTGMIYEYVEGLQETGRETWPYECISERNKEELRRKAKGYDICPSGKLLYKYPNSGIHFERVW